MMTSIRDEQSAVTFFAPSATNPDKWGWVMDDPFAYGFVEVASATQCHIATHETEPHPIIMAKVQSAVKRQWARLSGVLS
jgi:hypothetical protein